MFRIDLFFFWWQLPALPLMLPEIVEVRDWMDAHTFLNGIAESSKVALVYPRAQRENWKGPGGGYQVRVIVVKPQVVLPSADDRARLARVMENTNTIVSSPTRSKVRL